MLSSRTSKYLQVSLLLCFCCVSWKSNAVAFCALRDPVAAMQEFFPGFTSYRSYVGAVGPDVRAVLEEKLPYPMHFNEFGDHTLYVPHIDGKAMGLVHARTEKGDWGLDEIVWSLSLDLTVQDFRFQRSRSRWQSAVQTPEFKKLLQGKGFDELLRLLGNDGLTLVARIEGLPEGAEKLAATLVRSALKTIIVTDDVWSEQLSGVYAIKLSDNTQ
jgi:hypothetical protein